MSGIDQGDKWVLKEWTLAERFSANLLWLRRHAGLTQQELADRVGMNRVVLGALEQGRRLPRLDTILRLAAGLEVRNCDLVAWMWWDPATHEHFDHPAEPTRGQEVWDFDVPARFRISLTVTLSRGRRRPTEPVGSRRDGGVAPPDISGGR